MKYLVDSNIIIYYLKGEKTIKDFFDNYKDISVISLITYYEVLNFDFTIQEERIVKNFLENFEILNISKNIIHTALQNRKIKKIKMADNFILSTAQLFNLTLVTRNTKDFDKFKCKILNPFD